VPVHLQKRLASVLWQNWQVWLLETWKFRLSIIISLRICAKIDEGAYIGVFMHVYLYIKCDISVLSLQLAVIIPSFSSDF
jgi:hypothetical protein